ncbi:MAG TPA: chemotaxis response regulator protein-glutamate methylesterase [Myxococcota bacterium]|nr:chemotaxis response regulator protein-glutamate methylesterase [Myxococcota bacterium]
MAEQLKVLIVDDSAIYRSLVQGCLREMADVKCVGTAVDGRDAIVKAGELRPEVILLDVEMPVMNGVEAMPKLRSMLPDAGIIMVSSLTTNGANITMDALQAGAFDFVTKPQVRAGEDGFAALREPLGVVIEAFREGRAQRSRPAKSPAKPRQARGKVPVIDVIAIGCSTGGPSALAELIPELPADLRVPVLIVQHMPARFTASLATSLDRRSKLRVREAEEGRPLRAGEVLVAPGGKHLEVAMQDSEPFVRLTSGNVVNSFRPSVDVLFKSLSVSMPGRALCVVMTGMGADGLEGVKTVRQRGGWCIAQDQASCAVYGMPRSVVESGEADEVVALDQLAARLQEIAKAK